MQRRLTNAAKVLFSIPSLALINFFFGAVSIIAVLQVDKSQFPIICDLENFHYVLTGGYQSMQIVISETAVALRAAELGIPNVFATPFIPLFFSIFWFIKTIISNEYKIWLVNGILILLTFITIFTGFFANISFWLRTEKAKVNIWEVRPFINGIKSEAIRAHSNLDNDPAITPCNIALEMYTISKEDLCPSGNIYICYQNIVNNKPLHKKIKQKTSQWVYGE